MAIDGKKIGLIHVAVRQLGLDDEVYRSILREAAGVERSADLDQEGFMRVMARFNALGFVSSAATRNLGHRIGMASPGQVALIRRLWQSYTEGAGTDAALDKWIARILKVSALRFVTASQAPKAIKALQAMADHRARKKASA